MVIKATEVDGVAILFLAGDLDGQAFAQVRGLVAALVIKEHRCLVLDLAGVERVYTAGISELLEMHKAVTRSGSRLICCAARPFIRELLRITLPDRALNLEQDLESALDLTREAS